MMPTKKAPFTLDKLLDYAVLEKHIADGYVSVRLHPTLPLAIYNYTPRAAFATRTVQEGSAILLGQPLWGDGVIDYCRGLIVNTETQEVIARPFKKFHNLNTERIPETLEKNLPMGTYPNVTEKMDGSLGIYYRVGDEYGVATRGSFESDQAKWATAWYKQKVAEGALKTFAESGPWTPLFEIIFPENRIVVKYDFSGLVMLACVDIRTGCEYGQDFVETAGEMKGFTGPLMVKNYGTKNLGQILNDNETNREGYVLTFYRGFCEPPLKVKVKFDDYCRLHKIVTGISPKAIWEKLYLGANTDWLDGTPEHFKTWATQWVDKLFEDFNTIFTVAATIYIDKPIYDPVSGMSMRKFRADCAEYFKKEVVNQHANPGVLGILFLMLDGKNVDKAIWELVKPRGDDQSFRQDGEV